MDLIAYSDSESDGEAPAPAPAPAPSPRQVPKPSFAKVVDRSNPGKIKVNLPGASQPQAARDDIESEAPPAKKPRLGGASTFEGFNSMLPAPKKAGTASGKRGLGKGLASGVNLRTGAEPAFKREPKADTEEYDEQGNPTNVPKREPMNKDDFRAMLNLPPPKSEKKEDTKSHIPTDTTEKNAPAPPKPVAPRFVPMSVGKAKKKKPVVPRPAAAPTEPNNTTTTTTTSTDQLKDAPSVPPRKPKVSLFGVSQETAAPANPQSMANYQPMLYGAEDEDDELETAGDAALPESIHAPAPQTVAANVAAPSNDLTNIASELNLSEAQRRQLFGKKGREADFSSARIVEFNTDTEYAHNERLRQQGEQVQHNPLKSISGTGKNSLRSLVNVASTQKDALEDHFATSHRNKKEAGNKYGW